jgi:hypothetical protein
MVRRPYRAGTKVEPSTHGQARGLAYGRPCRGGSRFYLLQQVSSFLRRIISGGFGFIGSFRGFVSGGLAFGFSLLLGVFHGLFGLFAGIFEGLFSSFGGFLSFRLKFLGGVSGALRGLLGHAFGFVERFAGRFDHVVALFDAFAGLLFLGLLGTTSRHQEQTADDHQETFHCYLRIG